MTARQLQRHLISDQPASARKEQLSFEDMLHKLDSYSAGLPTSMFEKFTFELDGIKVDVRRVKQDKGEKFLITAYLGSLPFSIESPERRHILRTLVESSRKLPNVRFGIDNAGRITAGGVLEAKQIVTPDFIFHPLMRFLQEARPFMTLIGSYLRS